MNLVKVLVLLSIGLVLWVFYLAIPAFYLEVYSPGAPITTALILISPLLLLGAGIYFKSREILLLFYPTAILLPVVMWRDLASAQIYSPGTFLITTTFTLLYFIAVLAALKPKLDDGREPIVRLPLEEKPKRTPLYVRTMLWVYFGLGLAFYVLGIGYLNFSGDYVGTLEKTYGSNVDAAKIQLNLFGFFIWLTIFFYYLVQSYRQRFVLQKANVEPTMALPNLHSPRRRLMLASIVAIVLMIAFVWMIYYHRG